MFETSTTGKILIFAAIIIFFFFGAKILKWIKDGMTE